MLEDTRILVVDDDEEICELLDEYLSKSGLSVSTVGHGNSLREHIRVHGYPDIILLDVMLPGENGFDICQSIRTDSNVPIIMLTAVSDDTDQIIGLEIGADDYIAKPFSPRQLLARIKAVLRRVQSNEDKAEEVPPKRIVFGDWRLETVSQTMLNTQTHEEIELSGSDYSLLMLFLTNPKETIDKNTISIATRGREALPYERGIDVQLSRLRQQLGSSPQFPNYIKTMRGNGYILATSVKYEHE